MRIAVYHNLPTGGAKRALFELLDRTNSEIEYDLYCVKDQSPETMFAIKPLVKGIYTYPISKIRPNLPRGIQQRQRIKVLTKLQKKIAIDIDSNNYDAVFVHSCKDTHTPGLLKYLKTPSLYFIQEPRRPSFEYNLMPQREEAQSKNIKYLKKRMSRYLLYDYLKALDIAAVRSAGKLLCNSYFSMESIARAYGEYATVCYLGVDSKVFNYQKNIKKTNAILSVGALHPNKGHSLTVQALAKVKSKPVFHVVYDRELEGYKKELKELAQSLSVELELHHQISDTELANLYCKVKATISAAELEPFGFTPLESMACGTPVVAVKEGGYRETVNDENGILVDRSSKSLANGIDNILSSTNFQPKELSASILKQWSWQNSIMTYKAALKDLIDNAKN